MKTGNLRGMDPDIDIKTKKKGQIYCQSMYYTPALGTIGCMCPLTRNPKTNWEHEYTIVQRASND
jgi:hypothetical protein